MCICVSPEHRKYDRRHNFSIDDNLCVFGSKSQENRQGRQRKVGGRLGEQKRDQERETRLSTFRFIETIIIPSVSRLHPYSSNANTNETHTSQHERDAQLRQFRMPFGMRQAYYVHLNNLHFCFVVGKKC